MQSFPLTTAAFATLPDGAATFAHVVDLEARWNERRAITVTDHGPDGAVDFDVLLAGGGLSLFYGAYLAQRGLRVAIFDRGEIGRSHREWNASRRELVPLVASGLFTPDEVSALVEADYDHGICRWHGGGTYSVRGVLDCVVAAAPLLATLVDKARAAGATLLPHHALTSYARGKHGIEVTVGGRKLTGRVLLDGTGAASSHARFDLVCPTVGGVLAGIPFGSADDELDPKRGEILVTTEDVEDGRQHIWEGFPSRDTLTTYLFYYEEPERLPARPLLALYERFFATLPRYKRGAPTLVKATYGYIPAYTRLRPMPASPGDHVLLVGDAAARHSPLTFCGFGSMLRSFRPVSDALVACLGENRLSRRALAACWTEPPVLKVMGGLTLMMTERPSHQRDPHAVNELLDDAFATLHERGEETYAAFVRDELGFADFIGFMNATAKRHPGIYDEVFTHLTTAELARWMFRLGGLGLARR
ncbi:MAG: lycopene cyclase [Polyangia bacterium]